MMGLAAISYTSFWFEFVSNVRSKVNECFCNPEDYSFIYRVMSLRLGLNVRHTCVPISISFLFSGRTLVTTITLPPCTCTAS